MCRPHVLDGGRWLLRGQLLHGGGRLGAGLCVHAAVPTIDQAAAAPLACQARLTNHACTHVLWCYGLREGVHVTAVAAVTLFPCPKSACRRCVQGGNVLLAVGGGLHAVVQPCCCVMVSLSQRLVVQL